VIRESLDLDVHGHMVLGVGTNLKNGAYGKSILRQQ